MQNAQLMINKDFYRAIESLRSIGMDLAFENDIIYEVVRADETVARFNDLESLKAFITGYIKGRGGR